MDNKDNNRIWELCVKHIHNSLTKDEEQEYKQIKDSRPGREEMMQVKKIYRKTSAGFLVNEIDKEKSWQYIMQQNSKKLRIRKIVYPALKYAAVFVFALLVGISAARLLQPVDETTNRVEMEWGQMGKMTLSDNSTVWMNAGTVLEYPNRFARKKRTIHLSGEAQFKVTHNDNKPFEVVTGAGIVKVYGTTFNVAAYDEDSDLTVTLIEGKVAVENPNGQQLAILKPSEQISINKKSGQAVIKKVNTDYYTSWINGKILLNETKLANLVPMLKRWYNVDIQLANASLGEIQVSGTISRNKPVDLFFKVLEGMCGVQYKMEMHNNQKDKIIIYKK